MTDEIRDRLRKVYELVNRGATEGEKQAAKAALDRLMKKYNLSDEALDDISKKVYRFKYSTQLEEWLLARIMTVMLDKGDLSDAVKDTWGVREVQIKLEYLEWVTMECAYEYFRRHMKGEWNRVCAPELKRCRKAKTKNKRREELQRPFFSQYVLASKLYKEHELITRRAGEMSEKEYRRREMMEDVRGGQYNRQVVTGHQLPAPKTTVDKGGQYTLF